MTYEQRRSLLNSMAEQYGGDWDDRVRDDLEIPAWPFPDCDKIYFPPSYGVPHHV